MSALSLDQGVDAPMLQAAWWDNPHRRIKLAGPTEKRNKKYKDELAAAAALGRI